jgi:hypothetical protein
LRLHKEDKEAKAGWAWLGRYLLRCAADKREDKRERARNGLGQGEEREGFSFPVFLF